MLTGEIRSQIDSIWNDFWSGGVSNPLSVICEGMRPRVIA
jgi:type I restriction enzyme M protein